MKYANYPKDIFTFQFHKGTIKTVSDDRSDMCKYLGFQFHKGTIKTITGLASRWATTISIP